MAVKILIVDDDATMVRLLATILEIEGYETQASYSGMEALEIIYEDEPDLVLLDIMMPELDGFEVLAKLRKNPGIRRIPVIMLTARTETMDVFEGWKRGADGYVTKPFDPGDLVDKIKTVLSRSMEERLEEREQQVECWLEILQREDDASRDRWSSADL